MPLACFILVICHFRVVVTETEGHKGLKHEYQYEKTGWQGLAGFRGPQQNHSELSESAYLQIFATKTSFFTIAGKQAICGCQKT